METKHDKHGGSAFFWGLIIGALFATLLTTKRGRQILRELTNLGLELFEDFVEERMPLDKTPFDSFDRTPFDRTQDKQDKSAPFDSAPFDQTQGRRDKKAGNSEQKESDIENAGATQDLESEITEVETQPVEKIITKAKSSGNGHAPKRRLFRGIRRK